MPSTPFESGPADDATEVVYLFGSFRLVPSQQMLLDGDARVLIGGRAFDLLTALVERRGELVTKQELMARAWPRAVVEDSNLKVHIAALRKALGKAANDQRFVATVVGRGYQFVAPVKREAVSSGADLPQAPHAASHNLPAALVRPVGRAETIRTLRDRLTRTRILTVAGHGGIGKTTVALALAHQREQAGQHDVWFVNLSRLSDARFVPHAVAHAMGLAVHSDDILQALTNTVRLQRRPQLVVLDNCEHVIEAAAVVAEKLIAAAPSLTVLATSREPLQALGEHVYRLEPLASPPDSATLTMAEALRYPAVELFVTRAEAARGGFMPTDEEAPLLARICRRLDGIALAIELAATRLDAFGVRELFELLDDRFATLAQGRRTAPERQKTLLAALDWSHQLLPENRTCRAAAAGRLSGGVRAGISGGRGKRRTPDARRRDRRRDIGGQRLTAFAWHHMGRQAEARRLLAGVLEAFEAQCRQSRLSDNHVNGREGTRSLMASVLWFQGCAERALEEAYRARRDAEASGHTLTIG
ncbi:winged helix-turn-helix domain-containing protein [Caballeronia sp. LZ033]|uniref:ATP-binding protein n=1 Tax=Caballeronia sp. LZ033 TaxID=3038566 RepID=UPI0028612F88|nr:winged helix-turn-helix domain-containing protein [Caballeronia sp. LZ033]MDR5818651.1 winged helix-turn-helix domain-containing protein [Caballeronia sp. LZ033]